VPKVEKQRDRRESDQLSVNSRHKKGKREVPKAADTETLEYWKNGIMQKMNTKDTRPLWIKRCNEKIVIS
jgi:hypothetical protein